MDLQATPNRPNARSRTIQQLQVRSLLRRIHEKHSVRAPAAHRDSGELAIWEWAASPRQNATVGSSSGVRTIDLNCQVQPLGGGKMPGGSREVILL